MKTTFSDQILIHETEIVELSPLPSAGFSKRSHLTPRIQDQRACELHILKRQVISCQFRRDTLTISYDFEMKSQPIEFVSTNTEIFSQYRVLWSFASSNCLQILLLRDSSLSNFTSL
jgi:hypothetical protein